jgi:hypothetical protein
LTLDRFRSSTSQAPNPAAFTASQRCMAVFP